MPYARNALVPAYLDPGRAHTHKASFGFSYDDGGRFVLPSPSSLPANGAGSAGEFLRVAGVLYLHDGAVWNAIGGADDQDSTEVPHAPVSPLDPGDTTVKLALDRLGTLHDAQDSVISSNTADAAAAQADATQAISDASDADAKAQGHIDDASAAHAASAISTTARSTLDQTDADSQFNSANIAIEANAAAAAAAQSTANTADGKADTNATDLSDHESETTGAHADTAISSSGGTLITGASVAAKFTTADGIIRNANKIQSVAIDAPATDGHVPVYRPGSSKIAWEAPSGGGGAVKYTLEFGGRCQFSTTSQSWSYAYSTNYYVINDAVTGSTPDDNTPGVLVPADSTVLKIKCCGSFAALQSVNELTVEFFKATPPDTGGSMTWASLGSAVFDNVTGTVGNPSSPYRKDVTLTTTSVSEGDLITAVFTGDNATAQWVWSFTSTMFLQES